MSDEEKKGLETGCCVSFIATSEVDTESLFTRFGKNGETIRITGKLKKSEGKFGVVTIKNLEESWDVRVPKDFMRRAAPEKIFKFIDRAGKVVWDCVTDEKVGEEKETRKSLRRFLWRGV